MSDEDAARARLLAYYEQKERELLERAKKLSETLPGIADEVKRKRTASEVSRITHVAEGHRAKADQLRPVLRDDLPR
jgi:hypothetical protein